MKAIELVSEQYPSEKFMVSIVNDYQNNDFGYYYQVFPNKVKAENVGIIGVSNMDDFAIRIQYNYPLDYAFAVYLDGVNASQRSGIKSLSEIPEDKRNSYERHDKFIARKHNSNPVFLDRFSQKSEENRRFIFTNLSGHGINEVLIDDISQSHKIEIYFWVNKPELDMVINSRWNFTNKNKIGAGEATFQKFGTTEGLSNPVFFGKVMFVYLNDNSVEHLGKVKISKFNAENLNFDDPMDLVPKS